MRTIYLCLMLLFMAVGSLKAQGIAFRKQPFEAVQEEARTQGKLLFIDFYTTWCGPCKMIARDVFPLPEVGTFFNEHFVSCQLDAEREGKDLARKYHIDSYPTMLFINAAGDVMKRVSGAIDAKRLLSEAQTALGQVNDPNNFAAMQKRYEAGERGDGFLRLYIDKLLEVKESPVSVIEEFLKKQQMMTERSSRMMEFLMQYDKHVLLGGEAERIFYANYDTYMDIATKAEVIKLQNLGVRMCLQTREKALRDNNISQYELFMKGWSALKKKPVSPDMPSLYMELALLKGETDSFKQMAFNYLDSIVAARSVEDIKAVDKKRYDDYCARVPGGDFYSDALRESKKDVDARIVVQKLSELGCKVARYAGKKDGKHFQQWLDYGRQLLPGNSQMTLLEATWLYRQGKQAKAVALMEEGMKPLNPKSKDYRELDAYLLRMKKNEF